MGMYMAKMRRMMPSCADIAPVYGRLYVLNSTMKKVKITKTMW